MAHQTKPTTQPTASGAPVQWLYIGVGAFATKAHAVPDTRGTLLTGLCRHGGYVQSGQIALEEDKCKMCLRAILRAKQ